jgi:hypothetical protein
VEGVEEKERKEFGERVGEGGGKRDEARRECGGRCGV